MKLYYTANEDLGELVDKRKEVFQRGYDTGFHTLDNIASFLPGYQTLIYAPPHVGKTVITMDLLMAQAEQGRNICLYSPEMRDRKEVFYALIQAKLHKNFSKYATEINDDDFIEALDFVNDKFVVITRPPRVGSGVREKMSIKKLYDIKDEAQEALKKDIHFMFIDPMNYVEKGDDEKYMDTQEYVLNLYDQIGEFSYTSSIHTILSAHTRDVELVQDKETGKRYYPILHPSEVMGGQSNYRAGYQILQLWRAPEGVADEHGIPYPPNYTKIITQKSKPFGIGRIGDTSMNSMEGKNGLFFDTETYTMYEVIHGKRYYRGEYYNQEAPVAKKETFNKKSYHDEDIF